MKEFENFLFDKKEMYLIEHSKIGRSYDIDSLTTKQRRRTIYDNMHLMHNLKFTKSGFPEMNAYTGPTDYEFVAFSNRKKASGNNQAIHFFIDDFRFRNQVWNSLERTTMSLYNFECLLSPDFTLWRDLDTEFYNLMEIFRSRFIGAYWQEMGFNVIPTFTVGGLNSLSYCLDGLPQHSVIAISAMGIRRDTNTFNVWCYALRRLEEEKMPTLILVYGEEFEIPNLHTPIQFIPDFISSKLRRL